MNNLLDFSNVSNFSKAELVEVIKSSKQCENPALFSTALKICEKYYQRKIFVRGLIEFTNFCKNDCYYCGIRRSNASTLRYRLIKEDILLAALRGAKLGFNSFVLQGGEDLYFDDKMICDIVYSIKNNFPNCAVTLSFGEKSRETFASYKSAGVDRYLLRHETANDLHYSRLHPKEMLLANRKRCLYDLAELGFQVGAGFMVGSPFQTDENLAEDLLFLKELSPHMVGIGPFIPHNQTPFKNMLCGSATLTLTMLALTRILLPRVLLPSTTALATISKDGRAKSFNAGASVVMPNLLCENLRGKYSLYNDKASIGDLTFEKIDELKKQISALNFIPDLGRGDYFYNRV